MAQQSAREEKKTIADYGQRGKMAKSTKLKAAFRHARKEEAEHESAFHEAAESPAVGRTAVRRTEDSPQRSAKLKAPGKVEKVMHEFKHGTLHSGSKKGPPVKSRQQAIAIALSEARRGKKG